MAQEIVPASERERFYVRLGKNRRDRKLARYITHDRHRGANVSKLVKQLLYAYYTGNPMPGYAGAIREPGVEDEAVRQSALSAKLKKLSFETLSRG